MTKKRMKGDKWKNKRNNRIGKRRKINTKKKKMREKKKREREGWW